MNTSFDPLDLVNTYGAFGSVGRERLNVVFEGTDAGAPDDGAVWKAYPYKALPVELNRMPPADCALPAAAGLADVVRLDEHGQRISRGRCIWSGNFCTMIRAR